MIGKIENDRKKIESGLRRWYRCNGDDYFTFLYLWKYSIEKAEQHLHEIEELRQAAVYIDTMRQIALYRISLLYNMRSTDDPFSLDELHQTFSLKAGEFIGARDKLLKLNLSDVVRATWHEVRPITNATSNAQKEQLLCMCNAKSKQRI